MDVLDEINKKLETLESLAQGLKELETNFGIGMVMYAIVAMIVTFLGWRFLQSYAETYAKSFFNRSLSEFQGEIVKGVGAQLLLQKKDIEKELSDLRASLNVDTASKIDLIDKEREYLIEFYNSYNEWLFGSLDEIIISFRFGMKTMEKDVEDIINNYSKTNIKHRNFDLFSNNHNLIDKSDTLMDITLEYTEFVIMEIKSITNSNEVSNEKRISTFYLNQEEELKKVYKEYIEFTKKLKQHLFS